MNRWMDWLDRFFYTAFGSIIFAFGCIGFSAFVVVCVVFVMAMVV